MVCYFLQTRCDRRKVRISTEMRMDSRSSGIEETECADFFFLFWNLGWWLVRCQLFGSGLEEIRPT